MGLAKDRFMVGLQDDHLQEALTMQEDPQNLDEAREVAKRLGTDIRCSQENEGQKNHLHYIHGRRSTECRHSQQQYPTEADCHA